MAHDKQSDAWVWTLSVLCSFVLIVFGECEHGEVAVMLCWLIGIVCAFMDVMGLKHVENEFSSIAWAIFLGPTVYLFVRMAKTKKGLLPTLLLVIVMGLFCAFHGEG